ncbi:MAG: transcriptional repressor LexA [Candidatus Babeliales bacterium]
MSEALTKNQKQILDFITRHTEKQGYAPTHEQIMSEFGFSSKGTVQHYLIALESKGALKRSWHKASGIKLTEEKGSISLLGKVAAGKPIEYTKHDERISVPLDLLKNNHNHYALQVVGDSMIGEGILEDDFIIVRETQSAENGQIVIAMIDNEATVKRFYKKKSHIELHSANEKYKPILVNSAQNFRIVGVFGGLIRRGN